MGSLDCEFKEIQLMESDKRFYIHDASLSVWHQDKDSNRKLHKALKGVLYKNGFKITRDPRIYKQYRSISKYHNYGSKAELEFKSHCYPAGLTISFYQSIVTVNKNGGEYDFDKLDKMSYLMQLRWKIAINKLSEYLEMQGYEDVTKPNPINDAMGFIEYQREAVRDFHGANYYNTPKPDYNSLDKDKNKLIDGQIKYYRDRKGYLMRGAIYHDLNNVWWVYVNKYNYTKKASFEFFDCSPKEEQRKLYKQSKRIRNINGLKNKAVNEEDYERAIILRNILKREQENILVTVHAAP